MKNIYLIYIFLFISGCGYNLSSNSQTTKLSCPSILFGSGHTVYIGSSNDEISLSNVEYQGEINNAIFSRDCLLKNNIFSSELSILFIMKPFIDEVDFIDMPFYVAILNQNKEMFRSTDDISKLVLIEIGPRFCLNPIKAFEGSIGGQPLW